MSDRSTLTPLRFVWLLFLALVLSVLLLFVALSVVRGNVHWPFLLSTVLVGFLIILTMRAIWTKITTHIEKRAADPLAVVEPFHGKSLKPLLVYPSFRSFPKLNNPGTLWVMALLLLVMILRGLDVFLYEVPAYSELHRSDGVLLDAQKTGRKGKRDRYLVVKTGSGKADFYCEKWSSICNPEKRKALSVHQGQLVSIRWFDVPFYTFLSRKHIASVSVEGMEVLSFKEVQKSQDHLEYGFRAFVLGFLLIIEGLVLNALGVFGWVKRHLA